MIQARLREMLGEQAYLDFEMRFRRDLERELEALGGTVDATRATSHKLLALAGGLALQELSSTCRDLQLACAAAESLEQVRPLIDAVRREGDAALQALQSG